MERNRDSLVDKALVTYGKEKGYTSHSMYIDYPTSSKLTERQEQYIQQDISDFERVLYSEKFLDEHTGYRNYIDMDSWVDYFIINEFAMNHDAGNLSTYVYKRMEGKLQLAVWDFNNGFDQYAEYVLDGTEFVTADNAWLDRVTRDPVFIDRVVERYRQLRETTLSQEHIDELLRSYQDQLGEAIDRNFQIWGASFTEHLLVGTRADGSTRDITSYEAALEQLNTMIQKRLEFLDAHFTDLYERTEGR